MPIYEYRCDACEGHHEALQKLSDVPLVHCPHCGKDTLKRQISAAGFRLKGGGWYETDFKSGQRKNIAGESSGAASSPGSDSSSSTPAASSPQ